MVELNGNITAIMLEHGIIQNTSPVSCIGSGPVVVPDAADGIAPPQFAICRLVDHTDVVCPMVFDVLPHPPIDCPAAPVGTLRAADAAQMSTSFGSGAVSCDPASPADILATEFPGALEDDIVFSVQCSSTETPLTCEFDVVLAGRAFLSSALHPCCRFSIVADVRPLRPMLLL